jgi:hypothetical protein
VARHRAPRTERAHRDRSGLFRRRPAPNPVPATPEPEPTDLADTLIATTPEPSRPAPIPTADDAPTGVIPLTTLPVAPARASLHYPDGAELPLDCVYGGPFDGTRHRWIAVVPEAARVVNGMVIRVDRETVLAVALRDRAAAVRSA